MSASFYPLEELHRLYDGYRRCFFVDQKAVLLIQVSGELYLIENRCPHMDWPLDNGVIKGATITCPKHRIQFDLNTGRAFAPGSIDLLGRYQVIIEGGRVGLDRTQFL